MFSDGMGTDAPKCMEVGVRVNKLGAATSQPRSQKSLLRQKFQPMVQGTFKLAYDEKECSVERNNGRRSDCQDFVARGKANVNPAAKLPAYVKNKNEK